MAAISAFDSPAKGFGMFSPTDDTEEPSRSLFKISYDVSKNVCECVYALISGRSKLFQLHQLSVQSIVDFERNGGSSLNITPMLLTGPLCDSTLTLRSLSCVAGDCLLGMGVDLFESMSDG